MALSIIKALKAPLPSLKFELHKRIAGWEEPRPHFPLRASDLLKSTAEFCPREHAFMDMGVASKKGSFVGTSLRMTFNHGSFMERQIRDVYLRDIVVGQWKCGICNHIHPTFGKSPKIKCPSCGWGTQWTYNEPRFEDSDTGVSGGIDALLDIGQPKLLIVEIKTISPDDFKTLVAPLAEHKFRTSLYLKLAETSKWGVSDRVNTKESKILYVTKSFGFKDETLKAAGIKDAAFSPFKEFTILRNDDMLSTPLAKAKVLKVWRDDKKGMPCGICPNGLTKRAQGCPAVAACFSGKYQSTLTWEDAGSPKHPGKTLVT
jgi:hypothetical protein